MKWSLQSLNFNIIEQLRCVLKRQARNRYPPPLTLKELEKVLNKKWLKILLDKVTKLYDFICSRIENKCKAEGDTNLL